MITFLRRTFSIIDRKARMRFAVYGLGSVVIAALEALGVSLVIPLTQLMAEGNSSNPTKGLHWLSRFVEITSTEQAAAILAGMVLVTFTVKSLAAIALLRWGITNSLQQEARIAQRLFSRYLLAPHAFHIKHHSAEIQRTLNEAMVLVFRRALPFVIAASGDAFSLVAICLVIVINDPGVAVVGVLYYALVGLVYQRFISGRQKVAAKRAHDEVAARYRQVQEAVRATKELAILHREA
ncbi:MAG: ABC transporter transmembrane domain-containing protein, partial [Actinomycetota bacterium]|nr:ABC transporter transmembrane domain-containing protein [Actinomycetota bacterium]